MAETIAPARDAMKTPPPSNAPPPQQTPITHKAVTQTFSMDASKEMKAVYQSIAFETKGHYLVGLKPQRFLEEFMPWNSSTSHAYQHKVPSKLRLKNLQRVPPKPGQKESVMYRPFVDALDKWITKGALKSAKVPNPQTLRFLNTNLPDSSCNNLNPDISIYLEGDFTGRANFSLQQTHAEFKPDIGHDPFQHVSDEGPNDCQEETADDGDEFHGVDSDEDEDVFADEDAGENEGENDEQDEDEDQADMNVELNHDDADDGLLPEEIKENPRDEVHQEEYIAPDKEVNMARPSTSSNVEADTESGNHTRGQIAVYAGLSLSMTFRAHFFSILILGRYARFIRWDRRGAVVTHRFDYTKDPMLIFNFYLRYGQLTPLQRGFDSMVELHKGVPPKPVRTAFEGYHKSTWYGGAKFKRGEGPLSFEGFLRIKVTDKTENRTDTFFIPPPRYQRSSLFPFCRATRRSLACPDIKKPTMCFLKDSWHEQSTRTDCEADIYRTLKKEGVKHVASMRLGGNVDGMETQTQDWVEELSPKSSQLRSKMVCHRLVLDTVARDLSTFAWCKVLLSCVADAVEAAQQAYKVGILHRDLSAGNIMIVKDKETKEWRGLLIDWDMCLLWRKDRCRPRSGRTGTWAFISANILLSQVPVPHTLADDMESAFWVLLYEILLYLKHKMDPAALHDQMQLIFSKNTRLQDGSVVGGREKMNVLTQCTMDNSHWAVGELDKPGVNEVLNEVGKIFHRRYGKVNDPRFNLDNLANDPWFCNTLRDAARKMEPLCITPTGLKSPTNDSNAPDDPKEWKPASVKDSKIDYYLMPLGGDPEKSTNVQKRQESELSSAWVHGLDGSFFSLGKRSHIGEPEDTEEPPSKRWHNRPLPLRDLICLDYIIQYFWHKKLTGTYCDQLMGKGKRKGGLSGVSKFVPQSMMSTSSDTTSNLSKETPSLAEAEKRPAKRRKGNNGVPMIELADLRWVDKYDATGLVPHYTHHSQVPAHLQKYFSQRRRYFSLYSTPPGCLLDEEGWYSVTPELVADQIAERCRCDTILDAFCGVGGNSIAFAKTCQRVIALDVSPTRLALARHNAQIYGVADRIEFILSDYLSFAKSYLSLPSLSKPQSENSHQARKIDVVFLSPPWGGPSYLAGSGDDILELSLPASQMPSSSSPGHPSYSLSSILPIHGAQLFGLTRRITRNIAFYLPRNTRLDEISALLSEENTQQQQHQNGELTVATEQVEVEEEWMSTKLKALTCYFGGLVTGQDGL